MPVGCSYGCGKGEQAQRGRQRERGPMADAVSQQGGERKHEQKDYRQLVMLCAYVMLEACLVSSPSRRCMCFQIQGQVHESPSHHPRTKVLQGTE